MDRRHFLQNLAVAAAAAKALEAATAEAQPAAAPQPAASAGATGARTGGANAGSATRARPPRVARTSVNVHEHTQVAAFTHAGDTWTVYEDLRTRDGVLTFVSAKSGARVMTKSAEATFPDDGPPHLGLNMEQLGLSGTDLLAEALLDGGDDPDPDRVRSAAPPQGSAPQPNQGRGRWTTFVGTKEAYDVTPVFPAGSTRTFLPSQYFEELRIAPAPATQNAAAQSAQAGGAGSAGVASAGATSAGAPGAPTGTGAGAAPLPPQPAPGLAPSPSQKRYEGLVGGWMPCTRTVVDISPTAYIEHVIFGEVPPHPVVGLSGDQTNFAAAAAAAAGHAGRAERPQFIVQTWHRSTKVENGKIAKVVYGYTYPAFPPTRQAPAADAFYRALLIFADYWDAQLHDLAPMTLPDRSWSDMAAHCFAKELMIRPNGVSPKYGAVDRDYFGSEYDGFQDIFTSALYTNLEWGRFDTARIFLDDYFTHYVEPNGMINMRGPETGQFGLTLSLLARYFRYTRDRATMMKHRAKFEATAKVLTDLHDISLALPSTDQSHGLIRGWSESDACLAPRPDTWWQPYYANSAFAARGLKDLASVWQELSAGAGASAATTRMSALARDWQTRGQQLTDTLVASMRAAYRRDLTPPYMPPMPGTTLPFREAMAKERPSPQQWPHRLYAELLQPDVLPADLAAQTIDTLRTYGGTVLGVVANIGSARPNPRSILGFISYGYAQMLLRLDRIEEYLLFLYAHRYHDHTRGSWTAGEVSGIRGGTALFCIPAQQTIPLLVRWMLVLEDSDADRLYFGKAIPRRWVASGQPIAIDQAPTRWGRVNFSLASQPGKQVTAHVELARAGTPSEIQVKLRTPKDTPVRRVMVNGRPATLSGPAGDTVVVSTGTEQRFEIVGTA